MVHPGRRGPAPALQELEISLVVWSAKSGEMASDYTQPVIWRSTTEILAASARLIQRQPPEFTVEEREIYNFDNAPESSDQAFNGVIYVDHLESVSP